MILLRSTMNPIAGLGVVGEYNESSYPFAVSRPNLGPVLSAMVLLAMVFDHLIISTQSRKSVS